MPNPDVLSTHIADSVAVVTIGSAKRPYFDPEMSDALHDALAALATDDNVRVVVLTGGAPGYFIRHYSVQALVTTGENIQKSGVKWAEDAPYTPSTLDRSMTLAETMPKPVIAAICGSVAGGGFEFTLACDIRIAQEGDFLIGLPEINVGILPGAGGTQRLPRTIGTANALMHILMGVTVNPTEAAQKGFVHETVKGSALDRAMEIAKRLATHTPESVGYIKRLVRNATQTPLAEGLKLERNLFMALCSGEPALKRMRAFLNASATPPAAES
ncbi:MAG TPA: enoyl-CoA hydratase/isomerase family protein [Rhizomicrobium sp.]|jgi:enoyl-CoA hydratase